MGEDAFDRLSPVLLRSHLFGARSPLQNLLRAQGLGRGFLLRLIVRCRDRVHPGLGLLVLLGLGDLPRGQVPRGFTRGRNHPTTLPLKQVLWLQSSVPGFFALLQVNETCRR